MSMPKITYIKERLDFADETILVYVNHNGKTYMGFLSRVDNTKGYGGEEE